MVIGTKRSYMIIKINYFSNFVLKMRGTDVQIVPPAAESRQFVVRFSSAVKLFDTDFNVSTVDN